MLFQERKKNKQQNRKSVGLSLTDAVLCMLTEKTTATRLLREINKTTSILASRLIKKGELFFWFVCPLPPSFLIEGGAEAKSRPESTRRRLNGESGEGIWQT